mmetsp:Transcript_11238/g.19737  ORF Transcript_11238/g.19737 Transcript_11238/m.19737 type:complete len:707 (+) Transcript_11238:17-2137(+)
MATGGVFRVHAMTNSRLEEELRTMHTVEPDARATLPLESGHVGPGWAPSSASTASSFHWSNAGFGFPHKLHMPPKQDSPQADVHADKATLSWVNTLLGWIWPKANNALMSWVHDDLTPRLQESLPSPFKGAHFSRFTLGRNTPDFGPIEVIRHSENHVQVDLQINYNSDVDIQIDAGTGGITFGINKLTFAGVLCIVLRPLVDHWPLIGAMNWFFADKPRVSMRFTGLAAVAHYPGMDQKVQSTVDQWIRSRMVLPKSICWHFTRNEDMVDLMEASSHAPLGVLRVRMARARNLAGVNWSALSVDRYTSDPYCLISVGANSKRTSTVAGTTSPEWPSNEPSHYFVVYHKDQSLEIDVLGDDSGRFLTRNFVTFLGNLRPEVSGPISVGSIVSSWPEKGGGEFQAASGVKHKRVQVDTTQVSKDMLHVNDPILHGTPSELDIEAEWFDLVQSPVLPVGTGHPVALLMVELNKGLGFPTECLANPSKGENKGIRWRSRVQGDGNSPAESRRGRLVNDNMIEFPDLPIHTRLHSVIDKLVQRKYSPQEIAQICGLESAEVVQLYCKLKAEYLQKHEDLIRSQQHADHRVSLEWYETLTHFVYHPDHADVKLDLLDGEDNVIGHIGPLSFRQLCPSASVTKDRYTLRPPQPSKAAGLTAFFTSSQNVSAALAERYATVEMIISARVRYLRPGRTMPKRASFNTEAPKVSC